MFDRIKRALGWLNSSESTDLLPAAVFKDALRSAFAHELLPQGFEQVKTLKWVRSAKPAIRDVIELYSLKGASIAPRWGFSLDFVPHVAAGQVRWHRTAKSSMLDLVWDPIDFAGGDGWTLSRFTAPAALPRLTQRLAVKVCRAALADLARAEQVSHLPALYREWAARPAVRFDMQNYTSCGAARVRGAAIVAARGQPASELRTRSTSGAPDRVHDHERRYVVDDVVDMLLGLRQK
jgi:hypothetical protein